MRRISPPRSPLRAATQQSWDTRAGASTTGTLTLGRIPLLHAAEAAEDILCSYDFDANAYVTEPVDFERFLKVVQGMAELFVTVVRRLSR